MHKLISTLIYLCSISVLHADEYRQYKPHNIILTWQSENISTNITVNFQTLYDTDVSEVLYDTVSHDGDFCAYEFAATNTPKTLMSKVVKSLGKGLLETNELKRVIHQVELSQLVPGQSYYFICGDEEKGYSKERKFKTPLETGSYRVITGGDLGTSKSMQLFLRSAAEWAPDFVVIGGDIAYANGFHSNLWDLWLNHWEQEMIDPQGFTVPVMLAIGNHESMKFYGGNKDTAPYYYGFFAQGGLSYFSRRLGKDNVFIMLDSNHTNPHDGNQKRWLESTLKKYTPAKNKIAVYHVPFYPAHRGYKVDYAGIVHWAPLFEKYGVKYSFENHDHTFSRTHPIIDSKINPDGVVYFGTGCFGVGGRPVSPILRWYQKKAASIPHYWVIDINEQSDVSCRAVNQSGLVFDVYPDGADGSLEAAKTYEDILSGTQNKREQKITLRPLTVPEPLSQGVQLSAYRFEGKQAAEEPFKKLIVSQLTIPEREHSKPFAMDLSGYLEIKLPGLYKLKLNANSAAKLYLNDRLILDAKSGDNKLPAREEIKIKLSTGLYRLFIDYESLNNSADLNLSWVPPGRGPANIPADQLFYNPEEAKLKTLRQPILSPFDDAEEALHTGKVNTSSSDIEMTRENHEQIIALRFDQLALPENAAIQSATLQFKCDEASGGKTDLEIYLQDSAHAEAIENTENNISGRPLSNNHISWSVPPWTGISEIGYKQNSPELNSLLQDIVTKEDWQKNNAVLFVIKGYGKRVAEAFEGDQAGAAQLVIRYQE